MTTSNVKISRWIVSLAATGFLWSATGVRGQNYAFTNAEPAGASWFTPGNWKPNGIPTSGDDVQTHDGLSENHTCIIDQPSAQAKTLTIQKGGNQRLDILAGASLTISQRLAMGYGYNGTATMNIWGDVIIPYKNFEVGIYCATTVVVNCSVTQWAGSVTGGAGSGPITSLGGLGNTHGSYTLEGGYLTNTYLYVGKIGGGTGVFTQRGGTNSAGIMYILNGRYEQYGGFTQIPAYGDFSSIGKFAGGTGTYWLVNGLLKNYEWRAFSVGREGTGIFKQDGGTNDIGNSWSDNLHIGNGSVGSGQYRITGGTLTSKGALTVGSTNTPGSTGLFEVIGAAAKISFDRLQIATNSTLSLSYSNGLSMIAIAGVATLAGTLNIAYLGGERPTGLTTGMTYWANSGTFSTITFDPPYRSTPVIYGDKALLLDFRPYATILTIK